MHKFCIAITSIFAFICWPLMKLVSSFNKKQQATEDITMKKILSLLAILGLLFSFGCGGGEAPPATDGDADAEKPAAEAEKPAAEAEKPAAEAEK